MEITTKNQELFKLYTDGEQIDGATTVTPYDRNNPTSFNTVISNYDPNKANTFTSGMVDLRIFSNVYLTSDDVSTFTVIGPQGQANIINMIPCNGDDGAAVYHNITARHNHIVVSRKMLKTIDVKLIDAFGKVTNLNNLNISFMLVFEE